MENFLCNSTSDNSIDIDKGYDKLCHNDSQTFNNRPYHYIDVCKYSRECISAYRIQDGFINCADKMDENQYELVLSACSKMRPYRFQCSPDQPTCLTVIRIGNLLQDCKNKHDELSSLAETPLSEAKCNQKSNDDCIAIRQYITTSWITYNNTVLTIKSTKPIPFRAYCDSIQYLRVNADENITMCRTWWVCHQKQWQCRTGQCINVDWVLDEYWDCSDASDEEGIFVPKTGFSTHNLKLDNIPNKESKFNKIYLNRSLSKICNSKKEFPCVRINISSYINHLTHNEFCISVEEIGDGIIDCMGGLDEKNILEHCNQVTMLGNNYKCLTSNICIPYRDVCDVRCPNKSDDDMMCFGKEKAPNCSSPTTDFMCLNGQCAKNGWCDFKDDCLHGEDEYLCVDDPIGMTRKFYKRQQGLNKNYEMYRFQLPNPFINKYKINNVIKSSLSVQKNMPSMEDSSDIELLVSSVCSRSIGIMMYNGSIACFCAPQYYGDKCQFYSDRMTIILQLNFSQSFYEECNDLTLTLKFLVSFLFKNQTLDSYEFHVRPAIEKIISSKKINYVLYSRANNSLYDKRMRYFNRSNIINEHPYSLRIEAYELKINEKAKLVSVWQYPIYFDYLPNFRLVKMLRLTKSDIYKNPCLTNPCINDYQECHQLMNENSNYVCLCRNNYRGENCSIPDSTCLADFCSPNALCKPDYQSLLRRNKLPYCICPIVLLLVLDVT